VVLRRRPLSARDPSLAFSLIEIDDEFSSLISQLPIKKEQPEISINN
jgi:hypothetical protein